MEVAHATRKLELDERARRVERGEKSLDAEREEVGAKLQEAGLVLEDAQEVLDDLSQYDDRDAVYRRAGQRKIDMPTRDGGTRKVTINAVLDKDVEHLLAKNAEKVRQAKDLRDKLDKGTKHLRESDERKAARAQGQDQGAHPAGCGCMACR